MGGSEQLARLAGGSVGVGIALAAAFPFNGVPPHGVSGRPVPAQVEVRVLAAGVFTIDPVGEALRPTAFPGPGVHGGPTLSVTVRNISPVPLALSMRLTALSPALDDAATVRASGAGAVLANEALGKAATWSTPAGALPSGAVTTLRLRFKLRSGLSPDAYNGRLDIRQLELKGQAITSGADATTPSLALSATTPATSPATTPAATTPVPTVAPTPMTTPAAKTTPASAGH